MRIPEAYREYTRVVGEHHLQTALCCLVGLTGFGRIIKVDDAAHELQVARPRLNVAQGGFFVI